MKVEMDDLAKRVETLERIIVAMCSGQRFTTHVDENGRLQVLTEPPSDDDQAKLRSKQLLSAYSSTSTDQSLSESIFGFKLF